MIPPFTQLKLRFDSRSNSLLCLSASALLRYFLRCLGVVLCVFGSSRAMAALSIRRGNARLPPEVNRVLYIRNLPFNISSEEMYDIFGKYGAIRQIRIGTNKDTRGTAFVVYEDIYDAKNAVDHLSGFNVANRYLIVLYYQHAKMSKKFDQRKKEEELTKLQEKYGVSTKDK